MEREFDEDERQRLDSVLGELNKRGLTTVKDGKIQAKEPRKQVKSVTAAELMQMDIPPIEWLVDEILPVGLSLLGAPSKFFKSYMALYLCVSISNGDKFLGFDCNKHGCLYLDLESTKRRPRDRLKQILGWTKPPDNLHILTSEEEVGVIGDGLEANIENQLQTFPDIGFIVIDVLQMVRPPAKRNQTGYDRDYDDFKALKKIADKHNLGILLIHHTRKMKDPTDVFNELSGSVGVMGALDCAWVLTKDDRFSSEATLHITGRDMESRKLKIKFNKDNFHWEYIGTEEDVALQRLQAEYDQSPIVETIKKLVAQNNGHWEGSASEIKEASKYLSWEIYEDVRKIGSLINKYEALLYFDGIKFEFKKTAKKNIYIFNSIDSTNATNATDSINSIQLELEDIK